MAKPLLPCPHHGDTPHPHCPERECKRMRMWKNTRTPKLHKYERTMHLNDYLGRLGPIVR